MVFKHLNNPLATGARNATRSGSGDLRSALSPSSNQLRLEILPLSLINKVALDEQNRIAYTDMRTSGHPYFLSWVDKNQRRGLLIEVQIREISQIATLREEGYVQKAIDGANRDLLVRNYALDLIIEASKHGASDIHLMMRGTHADVQFEIQSQLYHFVSLFHNEGLAIARAIFQGLAQTKAAMFEELSYQNAQISGSEFPADCKISSCRIFRGPAFAQGSEGGSFMTIRLQYLSGHQKAEGLQALSFPQRPAGRFVLSEMGYTDKQIEKIEMLMNTPAGIVLFLAPVGMGKTTTLFQILQQLARTRPYSRQVCVEDPVENPMPWAVQMVITNAKNDEEVGIEYANLVRGALRMAMKILFLGEIRGPAVAKSVIEAALTGHSVWSTMHCPDPFSAVDRLELMDQQGLSRKRFCDHEIIRGLISQRLLPGLCKHCRVSLKGNESMLSSRLLRALETYGKSDQIFLTKEGGCERCNFTGRSKRFAVAEVVVCDEQLMSDFINLGTVMARKNYRARPDSDLPMLGQALTHVFIGEVDPRAVEEAVDLIPACKAPHVDLYRLEDALSTQAAVDEVRYA